MAAESARQLPPAIVVGVDSPIGLTVIRELGEHGVRVHGIGSRNGVGLSSRWLAERHQYPANVEGLLALINAIAAKNGPAVVMTISDPDTLALRQGHDQGLLPNVTLLVPPLSKLRLVQDKQETYRIAREVGVPVPPTWSPQDAGEPIPAAMSFPCVLKWAEPGQVVPLLRQHGLELKKSEYCYNADELRRCLARYAPVGRFPLVQGFVPGTGLGHMLFMHGGMAILRFAHRRLAEWPPEGGTSVVCRSMPSGPDDPLLKRSEELLRRIGWEGPAMVEYRHDYDSGRTALMEVNGRFWGSLPLARHSGAEFAWYSYAVLGAGLKLEGQSYRAGVICRYVVPETRRLFTILFNRRAIQNRAFRVKPVSELALYLARFFDPRVRYFVFGWRDPKPFFHDIALIARKLWRLFAKAPAHD